MEEHDYVRVLGLVGFFVVGALVLLLALLRSRRVRKEAQLEEAEREKKVQEGIDQGVLARDPLSGDVYARCIVCGGKATTYSPITGKSWMDRIPLLNQLFSLPPRYTIVDNEEDAFQYCKVHKEVAVKKLEQFHAALRAERSQFNSQQADKVAQMDAGGLHQVVLEQHKVGMELLEQRKEKLGEVPMLPPAAPSTKQVLSKMTTSSDEGEEEVDSDRPHLEVVNGP
jgi:hypothetical protein